MEFIIDGSGKVPPDVLSCMKGADSIELHNLGTFGIQVVIKRRASCITDEVIRYLNEKLNKKYKSTGKKIKGLIEARASEGFELADFVHVINVKAKEWKGGAMEKYLRPDTLFGSKFESYVNQSPTKTIDDRVKELWAKHDKGDK